MTFYEYFGRATIVKIILYFILEFTRTVHVFWNFGFQNENFRKPRIDVTDAPISCNQYLITSSNIFLLTSIIDTV